VALEQLELRDALLAEPAVIAGLPRVAQQRLAGRFWAGVALDAPVQSMAPVQTTAPEQRLRRMDAQRQQQGQDAFLMGQWAQTAVAETLTPFYRPARSAPSSPLPALVGAATATAAQEARALAGRAGAAIEDLIKYSGITQLERVTGWPAAVLAIDDRLYINGAWLTAVAALEPGEPIAPGSGGSGSIGPTRAGNVAALAGVGGAILALPSEHPPGQHIEALTDGTPDPAAPPSGAAATGSSSSCSDPFGCNNSSCNNSSCNNSSSTSSSSCNQTCGDQSDHQCCRACALMPARSGPDPSALLLLLWLATPLAWLAAVDLRARRPLPIRRRVDR
jgi:hypothetical protein